MSSLRVSSRGNHGWRFDTDLKLQFGWSVQNVHDEFRMFVSVDTLRDRVFYTSHLPRESWLTTHRGPQLCHIDDVSYLRVIFHYRTPGSISCTSNTRCRRDVIWVWWTLTDLGQFRCCYAGSQSNTWFYCIQYVSVHTLFTVISTAVHVYGDIVNWWISIV